MNNLTGIKFTNLEAVFPVSINIENLNRVAYWLCECDCGNQIVVNAHDLKRHKIESCGCLKALAAKKRSDEKFLGKRFGLLTVIERVGTNSNRATLWKCKCDCGNEVVALGLTLMRGATTSCGCLRKSLGEYRINQVLKENNISFKAEYSFPDLKSPFSNHALRYDFAILKDKTVTRLIEFDGEQHEQPKEHFGGHSQFEKTKILDEAKNQYAINNGIPLARIPYKYKESITLDLLFNPEFEVNIPPTTTERERHESVSNSLSSNDTAIMEFERGAHEYPDSFGRSSSAYE